ncbi:MAG: cupin domain-containing protein [Bacillota bacterium]|jgi:quercetin dioxygenase-like cupin family protein
MSGKGQVMKVSDLAGYASDSIVSRALVNNKAGSLTLFAFDQGQALSEHSAPFDAVVHVVDGQAEVTIGGEKMTVGAGDLVIMPANVPHALRATSKFKMMLTMIRG